jgi:uncharacterized protein YdeI (YjbR/CyaY-like superfamily)
MDTKSNLPILSCETAEDWETWLRENHSSSRGVWLKMAKKDAGLPSVYYEEALVAALCYGWIDGQKGAFDDRFWLQKFTSRGSKSTWSKVNCAKAQALIKQGRMQPAGLAQVELAKADGRWEAAYESQSQIGVPPDLQEEFDKNPQAKEFFDTLNSINRYAVLYRIQNAKKPETRLARIAKFIQMLANHEVIYP